MGLTSSPVANRSDAGVQYWERLRGLSGEFDDIITNGSLTSGPVYIDILETDVAFSFKGNNTLYIVDSNYRGNLKTTFGDGMYIVGIDIEPGRYRSNVGVQYWARLKGFSGDFGELIANDAMVEGTAYVEIKQSDVGFETKGAQWIRVE